MSVSPTRATVSQLNPLQVKPIGSSAPVAAFKSASYSPAVGDVVAVVDFEGSKCLILLKIG